MSKRRLYTSMAVGALIGGVYALFDKGTREYTKGQIKRLKDTSSNYLKNPADTLHNARMKFEQLNNSVSYQVENAINALEQVETTINKVSNKNKKQIEDK